MNATKTLKNIEASERLKSLGFVKTRCCKCDGRGLLKSVGWVLCPPCDKCGGDGVIWKKSQSNKPISKTHEI